MPHEPKRRHSRQRKGKRRASIKFDLPTIAICKNCGSTIIPHRVCGACGYYKGKLVITK
ncbi:MAG: 50S ribosomal protein L32 [Candidatus Levybacteria bacterium RIFCSPHIGHO2_12_FULL_39_39]|nr:MAG: 50S ribosomal protein L32 [Candidatus Levybacteria bacterium RIFCSPHIGHO2_01_FULL_38_96]OGH25492.1 MAG: 50S ribosomal protein L32 [Candidatus Levybacteria bacterium RIFCSPHIGHO2_12_FULL_39_39]OGH35994.1 MAG: 50S ribosomal protein L32 [Candidatus Levybacteria bacterium RIFCSPLOWO2_01_FULL_38_120]OGH45099.1 MAG: 50S ribosomal protein L32 [Candidatus Levybacteria bacterium RIFCSPLOWO2_02_FULL_39_26]